MSHNREAQQWVLLGNAPVATEVWGLREINFPCGYMMPPGAFALAGEPLERPGPDEVWAMGGFAVEINRGGKHISAGQAAEHVAGYRPWLCVFHDRHVDELTDRGHTIEMWDRGLSIFHGLWCQSSQFLGELIPVDEFSKLMDSEAVIECAGKTVIGDSASKYVQDASAIIPFMSEFMTVSPGDLWVQGPLVASRLPKDVDKFSVKVGDLTFEAMVK